MKGEVLKFFDVFILGGFFCLFRKNHVGDKQFVEVHLKTNFGYNEEVYCEWFDTFWSTITFSDKSYERP